MIFGMSTATYTFIHVLISLVGIASGFAVLYGLISRRRLHIWNSVFLATTAVTSLSGFGFPFDHLLPSHIVGIISLAVLLIAIRARDRWGRTYAICASLALYLNCFVLVVQAFQKAPALKALAPTQSEPPFAVVQLAVLALFIFLGTMAARRAGVLTLATA